MLVFYTGQPTEFPNRIANSPTHTQNAKSFLYNLLLKKNLCLIVHLKNHQPAIRVSQNIPCSVYTRQPRQQQQSCKWHLFFVCSSRQPKIFLRSWKFFRKICLIIEVFAV